MYDVILVRHANDSHSNVCIFYDEDKALALCEISKYVKQNGFSIKEKAKRYSIADVILRERKPTGEIIKETSYHKLFNAVTNMLLESEK